MPGPSAPQPSYTTLENRLSQPESKKARKRRRKAERQALEARQNRNWLNGPGLFASGVPILPPRSWSTDVQMYGGYPPPQSIDRTSLLKLGLITGFTPPPPDEYAFYDNREPHSVTSPPPPSHWVSSMAKAASDTIDLTTEECDETPQWSPSSTHIPLPLPPSSLLPPSPLPPPLPHATSSVNNPSRFNVPKPIEHHALPPKPPPLQPVQTTIGMKPDQDPNSKHGIFQLASATKEAGTDVKKKGPHYIPNPSCTIVMEQLPKTHRHPDFINNWSKSACSAQPVHILIDVPGGKALVEFATSELARKAWASPKLGPIHPHQLKGKPREDLIKVWWYRVNGVGAGSGVGEIEEGEIEGDAIDRDPDQQQPVRKETKKEKKARLAKEREEKRVKRELELRLMKERNVVQVETPTNSTGSFPRVSTPTWSGSFPGVSTPTWSRSPAPVPTQHLPISSDDGSWGAIEWDRPPAMGDDWMESWGVSGTWTVADQANVQDDHESNMEVGEPPIAMRPVVQPLPLHSSLPPRPAPSLRAPVHRPPPPPLPPPQQPPPPLLPPTNRALPSSQFVSPIPQTPPPPPTIPSSESSSSSLTSSPTPLPSEPRAMKNAPTEPSFTKRVLMARQKELEERIAKSKLELAETRAGGSSGKPVTPVSSVQLAADSVKPSMDLGEKQAMEDRLRKLVLQSQRARGKAGATTLSADNSNDVSASTTVTPSDVPSISSSTSSSSSSSLPSSVPSPVVPSNQLPLAQLTAVSLSAHNFSLEDLAVSFITQTIETIKSQPVPTPTQTPTIRTSNKAVSAPTQSNNNNNNTTKFELAAKQKQLEQHIMESKNLMTKLAQARTKEEKDTILKAMREMSRCVPISVIYQHYFGCPYSGLTNWTKWTLFGDLFSLFFLVCLFLLGLSKKVRQSRRRTIPSYPLLIQLRHQRRLGNRSSKFGLEVMRMLGFLSLVTLIRTITESDENVKTLGSRQTSTRYVQTVLLWRDDK